MNGATLRTIREALGLSVPWFADYCNVRERTVRHWESGRNAVPAGVEHAIFELEKASTGMADQLIDKVRALIAQYGPPKGPIPVERFDEDEDLARFQPNMKNLPVTFHAAAIARARWSLAGKVEIVARMIDVDAYEAWLDETGQADSPQLRSLFLGRE
jgi:hypothetical protein